MQANKTFNPRLIITEHFDKIKYQIDIKTETIIDTEKTLTNKDRFEINKKRDEQIEKIAEIEHISLTHWPVNFDEKKYELEWNELLNDVSFDYDQKVEKIKEKIILWDCILIEMPSLIKKISLLVVPFFLNKYNTEFTQ